MPAIRSLSHSLMLVTNWLKSGPLWPHLQIQLPNRTGSWPWKPLLAVPGLIYKIKLKAAQGGDAQGKGEWRWPVSPCSSEHGTFTASSCPPPCKLSEPSSYVLLFRARLNRCVVDYLPLVIDFTLHSLPSEVLQWEVVKKVHFKWIFGGFWRPAPSWRYLESPLVTHLITYKVSKFQEF